MWHTFGESVKELVDNAFVKAAIPVLTLILGFYGKRVIDWFKWRKKQFLHRMIVSLNSIHEGKLLIRTITEKSVADVFLNSVAVDLVMKAATQTTNKDPLLPLPKDDAWHVLNSVLNAVAEEFNEGVVRRDMGLPVRTVVYVLCLTHEVADDIRQDKIRAMLLRKDLMLNLPEKTPLLESQSHELRYYTLKQMAANYKTRPELFTHVEICLPIESTLATKDGERPDGGHV